MVTPETQVAGTNPPREYAYLSPLSHASCAYLCKHLLICKTCPVLQTACRHQTAGRHRIATRAVYLAGSSRLQSIIPTVPWARGGRGLVRCIGGRDFFLLTSIKPYFFFFFACCKIERDITVQLKFYPQDAPSNSGCQILAPA